MAHNFVPTFYHYEGEISYLDTTIEVFNIRKKDFKNIPIIFNAWHWDIINNGIISGVTVSHVEGGILYLSDTVPGGYVQSTSSLNFSARTNEIGYTLQSGTTTGVIYININNEDNMIINVN